MIKINADVLLMRNI